MRAKYSSLSARKIDNFFLKTPETSELCISKGKVYDYATKKFASLALYTEYDALSITASFILSRSVDFPIINSS